jgi:hypothetical protein
MLHIQLHEILRREREHDLAARLELRRALDARADGPADVPPLLLSVLCGEEDAGVRLLAALNEVPAPTGRHVVAVVGDDTVAAVALGDGTVLRDPFRDTLDVVPLLELHARNLRRCEQPKRRRWRLALRSLSF